MKETYCHYAGAWIALGRARTRCPKCGAALTCSSHAIREAEIKGKATAKKIAPGSGK